MKYHPFFPLSQQGEIEVLQNADIQTHADGVSKLLFSEKMWPLNGCVKSGKLPLVYSLTFYNLVCEFASQSRDKHLSHPRKVAANNKASEPQGLPLASPACICVII